jgi:hypothetical protein
MFPCANYWSQTLQDSHKIVIYLSDVTEWNILKSFSSVDNRTFLRTLNSTLKHCLPYAYGQFWWFNFYFIGANYILVNCEINQEVSLRCSWQRLIIDQQMCLSLSGRYNTRLHNQRQLLWSRKNLFWKNESIFHIGKVSITLRFWEHHWWSLPMNLFVEVFTDLKLLKHE